MLRIAIFSIVLVCCSALTDSARFGIQPMPDGRIVGGENTDIKEHAHQISIRYYGMHRCGGCLIRENAVLTAAHCVVGTNRMLMAIVAGQTFLNETNVGLPILRFHIHNNYSRANNDYDVAILELKGALTFGENIKKITLANSRPEVGTKVTVTGWGTLKENGRLSNRLQSVNVTLIDNEMCKKVYQTQLTNRMLCAGEPDGGMDSCQGDSGGPLVVGNDLLGIVSWGYGCARKMYPGVYTSVPDLFDWIETTANAI